jgi:hypothetical protein
VTYEQIFKGRMTLIGVQRHICQAHLSYPKGSSGLWKFTSHAGHEAFWIVEQAMQSLEKEFDSKRRSRKQRRAMDRQVLQK